MHSSLLRLSFSGSMVRLALNQAINFNISSNVTSLLMVVSHERSGTHLAMNTFDYATEYSSRPFINFDLIPLGATVNFFSASDLRSFLTSLVDIKTKFGPSCCSSIIKSHFPVSFLGKDLDDLPLNIVYVFREPYGALLSYWKFIQCCEWYEGFKTQCPLDFVRSAPRGQCQRYQSQSYQTYFHRWSQHIRDGMNASARYRNVTCLNYDDLLDPDFKALRQACDYLNINTNGTFRIPSKNENVIYAPDIQIPYDRLARFQEFCAEELDKLDDIRFLFDRAPPGGDAMRPPRVAV